MWHHTRSELGYEYNICIVYIIQNNTYIDMMMHYCIMKVANVNNTQALTYSHTHTGIYVRTYRQRERERVTFQNDDD